MASTPMLERWLAGLPDHVREVIVMAGETVEEFSSDVKMMSTLASLAFMRAIDSESGRVDLKPKDQVELLKVAGNLIEGAAKLKEQRLQVLDTYENISDMPKPANMEYMEVSTSPALKVKRLLLVKMDIEAEALAKQYGINIEEVREQIASEQHHDS